MALGKQCSYKRFFRTSFLSSVNSEVVHLNSVGKSEDFDRPFGKKKAGIRVHPSEAVIQHRGSQRQGFQSAGRKKSYKQ